MSSGRPLTLRMSVKMRVITVDFTTFIVCRGRNEPENDVFDVEDDVDDDDDDDGDAITYPRFNAVNRILGWFRS